jgi:hypothetical protein
MQVNSHEIAIIISCMILVLYNIMYLLLNDKSIGIKCIICSTFYGNWEDIEESWGI